MRPLLKSVLSPVIGIGVICALASCSLRPLVEYPSPTGVATLSPGPSKERTQAVLQAYFDAYNDHDSDGVLATLSPTSVYGDCDYAHRTFRVFRDKEDLTQWLQSRFAEDDRFKVVQMTIGPAEGSPPNDPRLAGVEVLRSNATLDSNSNQPKQIVFKIVLAESGDQIQYLNTQGNVACQAGR